MYPPPQTQGGFENHLHSQPSQNYPNDSQQNHYQGQCYDQNQSGNPFLNQGQLSSQLSALSLKHGSEKSPGMSHYPGYIPTQNQILQSSNVTDQHQQAHGYVSSARENYVQSTTCSNAQDFPLSAQTVPLKSPVNSFNNYPTHDINYSTSQPLPVLSAPPTSYNSNRQPVLSAPQTSHQPPIPPLPQDHLNTMQQSAISSQQEQRQQQSTMPPFPPMPMTAPGPNTQPPMQQHSFMNGSHVGGAPMMPPTRQPAYPTQYPLPNHPQMNGVINQQPFSQPPNMDLLPSAVEVTENDRTQCVGPYNTAQRGTLPPLVTTDFSTRDQGNCGPRFVRSSMYSVPATADLLKTVGIPLTLSIAPFAEQHPEDMQIMISDLGPQGPVRCSRCKAYINPFMNFIDGGRRFQCPLCSHLSDVPNEYFSHLDHTGRRVDACQRPELCLGSYELIATTDYCTNGKMPSAPAFIFLLDVSQSAVRSGLVDLFCSQFVDRILPRLPRESYAPIDAPVPIRIGFMTYDHQLHFYTLSREPISCQDGNQTQNNHSFVYGKPQMHIVADIEDVFVPTVEGFLIPPDDPTAIDTILQMIPTFCNTRNTAPTADAVLGPAVQAGLEALKAAGCAGKLFVMHANLPTADAPGKLKNRDDRRLIGTEKEKNLLLPHGDFYTGLGEACVRAGCSVDLFLFPNSYVDVATLAEVSKITSGNIYKYNCFQADLNGEQFLSDIEQSVGNLRAFDAVMRVRTSTGIRPVEFYFNGYSPNTTDMMFGALNSNTSVAVELKHDDKLQEGDIVFIQAACLYTSVSGCRRLRIHNLSLLATSSIAEVFRLTELDAHMNWMCKYAMRSLLSRKLNEVLEDVTTRVATTLAAYRKHCTGGGPGGNMGSAYHNRELILPQNMKLYPLYIQCLMKCEAFVSADAITIDDRCWQMFLLNQMDVKSSNVYLYPHLYPVTNLATNFENDIPYPPPAIRCSYDRLRPDSAYLLDNGLYLILWIGANVPSDWLQDLFSLTNPKSFENEKIYNLYSFNNDVSRNMCSLFKKMRKDRYHYSRLFVIRSGDKNEMWFRRLLVEDRCGGSSISYTDYLCQVVKEVTSLLR